MNDLDSRLSGSLRAVRDANARGYASDSVAQDRVIGRVRRRRSLDLAGGVGLVMALILIGTLVFPRGNSGTAIRPAGKLGTTIIPGVSGETLAASDDAVWVENASGGASIIDPATNKIREVVPDNQIWFQALAATSSGLWRVGWVGDMPVGPPGDDPVTTIQFVTPSGQIAIDRTVQKTAISHVVADDRDVYMANQVGPEVWRVDPATGEVTGKIRLPKTASDLAIDGPNLLLATSGGLMRISRSDIASSGGGLEIVGASCFSEVVVSDDSIWGLKGCGDEAPSLHRFNRDNLQEVASVVLSPETRFPEFGLTSGGGSLWLLRAEEPPADGVSADSPQEASITQLSSQTGRATSEPTKFGLLGGPFASDLMSFGAGAVWILTADGVARIDSPTAEAPVETPEPIESTPPEAPTVNGVTEFSMWPRFSLEAAIDGCNASEPQDASRVAFDFVHELIWIDPENGASSYGIGYEDLEDSKGLGVDLLEKQHFESKRFRNSAHS
jgi:hypothetical protein